ncbi:MAG: DUF5118 domain-containing protein [Balneolaceae bacterium]|nr:DUF5118 domain-containing protein [Balneolaceae bacterium]
MRIVRSAFLSILAASFVVGCSVFKGSTSKKQQSITSPKETKFKPYTEVITGDAQTDEGLFDVHKVDEDFFYEIPDTLLGRELLLVSRIAKTADNVGYGEKN